jgi:hypothetical protein
MSRVPNDYFWKAVDAYESGDRSVRSGCDDIIAMHTRFGIKDLEEAVADYELLTNKEASAFVRNYLKKGLQLK